MTDPALLGHLRILEAKLDRLTEAIVYVGNMLEAANDEARRLHATPAAHVSGEPRHDG